MCGILRKMSSILLIATLLTACIYVNGQSCRPFSGGEGDCKSLYDCKPLFDLVNKPNRTSQDDKLLRESQCDSKGTVPANLSQVCCPKPCYTPEGQEGQCISLISCPHLANLLVKPVARENVAYVRQFVCTGPEPQSVCCAPASGVTPLGSGPVVSGRLGVAPAVGGPAGTGGPVGPVDNCNDTMTAFPPDRRTKCCGYDSSAGNKIVGGQVAGIDEYPWLVVIEYIKLGVTNLYCGGSLISGKYVLTAGHCVAGQILDYGTPKNVRLGEFDTGHDGPDCVKVEAGGEDCTDGMIVAPIEKTIPHPEYRPYHLQKKNDIALIRLKNTAPYTYFIRPICLPSRDYSVDPPPEFRLFVAGWGRYQQFSNGTNRSSKLKLSVDVPFVDRQICEDAENRLVMGYTLNLWKGHICAGGEPGKDSCKGDSGGALMYAIQRVFEAVGVLSFGPKQCGQPGIPGVYTNVYEYIPWIMDTITP